MIFSMLAGQKLLVSEPSPLVVQCKYEAQPGPGMNDELDPGYGVLLKYVVIMAVMR